METGAQASQPTEQCAKEERNSSNAHPPQEKMTDVFNSSTYVGQPVMNAPLYPAAVVFPVLGFISWIICIPSMVWHFQQSNVAMASFILWIILQNFFNSINPLIWPRDNLVDWWDGSVWCDIQARLQVGCGVGLAVSSALIVRKLANVMDTRNITISSSSGSKTKERVWEAVWCWGTPFFLMVIYFIIQPVRYMIYGITGCIAAYDTSWPSIPVLFLWAPVAMCFAAYWAALLVYRLYRYRRDFHRLVTSRNSTKSRFIRLFILSMVVILVYLVYSIYLLVQVCLVVTDPYSWSNVHDPVRFNTIMRIPVYGQVNMDKWIQIVTGFVIFALFGTGVDAHNLYKRILVSVGAGRIWPSLYEESQHGGSCTPNSFIAARSWTSDVSSRAKSMLSSSASKHERATRSDSIVLDRIATTEDSLKQNHSATSSPPGKKPSSLKRWFATTPYLSSPILPFFSHRNFTQVNSTPDTNRSVAPPSAVHAQNWAAHGGANAVHVVHVVHHSSHERRESEKDGSSIDALV
ncbi:a-pheromone receptor [Pyrenophora seminiperda CCB06]|uniref:A-pheromone receptor n=1 Tax=Pyrenophora seminiperda CCB06 TaxID=1302712 RepID=A0A3M7M5J5_9PLEO|nr:a-pheromone receptor [Pyrenophora seminiperda CCB06]